MGFGQVFRSITRTAQRSSGCKHDCVFYDVRISNVEEGWTSAKVGWILGKGRPDQWYGFLHVNALKRILLSSIGISLA
jgi:hypothetical protein